MEGMVLCFRCFYLVSIPIFLCAKPHERIVASVIYYYDTDLEILDHGLGLRRPRDETDFPTRSETHEARTYPFYAPDI
jgi:hypothetical protein